MRKITANALLLIAVVLPIVLFWHLGTQATLNTMVAAAIAVAMGWALNVAWAFATPKNAASNASQANAGTLKIAVAFGWACPLVLVFLTWLALRFLA